MKPRERLARLVLLALVPLAAIVALVWLFVAKGDQMTAPIRGDFEGLPKPEAVSFERVVFKRSQIVAYVRNTGPEPIKIAGVHVNDMATRAYLSPSNTIPRLGSATVTIPMDWVPGDPYEIRLVSATGLFHSTNVEIAALTPTVSWRYLGVFALLGIYVGVIPVYLGLAWFPVLRKLSEKAVRFFLAFTIGLLMFLGVSALTEALDLRERAAGALQPTMVVLIGVVGSFLLISAVGDRFTKSAEAKGQAYKNIALAFLISFAIGVHNFGEGLAIGAAYSIGQATLGGILVLGFMIHNTTEGIAIVTPVTKTGVGLGRLAAMGMIAGLPTIVGAWVGGFSSSPIWSVLFLSIGAGAVLQVIYVLLKNLETDPVSALTTGPSLSGLLSGFALMYATSLMVA